MRYELKSIGVWAFTKVSFFVNLPVGFILGLLYAAMLPFMMMGMAEFGGYPGVAIDPSEMSFGIMLVILPILGAMFAAVFHTIVGVVLLVIYNMIVRMVGGLEFELNPVTVEQSVNLKQTVTTHAKVSEATVDVQPVSSAPSTSTIPLPPPAVPDLAKTIPSPDVQPPVQPSTEIPESPKAPELKPPTTENQSTPEVLQPKSTDDKTGNNSSSAPDIN